MPRPRGTVLTLASGRRIKMRIQHPDVHERTDRRGSYWYIRYWEDVPQPNGTTKAVRRFRIIGPSKGDNRLTKKEAVVEREKFLATINKLTVEDKLGSGCLLVSEMAEKYLAAHVEAQVAGRYLLAKPTREKYAAHLENYILPKWGKHRLTEIRPDEVQR